MSIDTRTMRKPVTRVDWPTDKNAAEFVVVGDAPKPTALDDANVYPIPLVQAGVDDGESDAALQEVEELWQFLFRTSNADSDCQVIIWCYNVWLQKWYPWAVIEVKGENLLDTSHGGVFTDNGTLGCSHIGIQVDGHGVTDELYVGQMWR